VQISVTLSEELSALVWARMASGDYASEDDVVREGLEMLADRDRSTEQWLRSEVVVAYEEWEADRSNVLTIEELQLSLQKAREQRRRHP